MNRCIVKGKEEYDKDTMTNLIKFRLRENGKVIYKKIPFDNFFYISSEDYDDFEFMLQGFVKETEEVTYLNQKYVKCFYKNNLLRNIVKKKLDEEKVEHFEMDINAVKRFNITNQKIDLNQKGLEHIFLDIETDDRLPMQKEFNGSVIANSCITSIAFKDAHGKAWCKVNDAVYDPKIIEFIKKGDIKSGAFNSAFDKSLYENEVEVLFEITRVLKKYDVTLSWNGWRFDVPFIKQRFEKHGLDFDELMSVDLDYMEIYKKNCWDNLKSYSLNNVGLHEFKDEINNEESKFTGLEEVTKIDWKEKTGLKKFYEFYLLETELFIEYNLQDVNIMYLIEQKQKFMDLQNVISEVCHAPLIETVHNSKSFDYAMLNEYHNNEYIAPSKPNMEELEKRKEIHTGGGYTYVYKNGVRKNAACFDYKSFYPTQVVTFNISPDTFVRCENVKLENVFSVNEIKFIIQVKGAAKNFLNAQGVLNKKKYEKAIVQIKSDLEEETGENIPTMFELMYKFVDKYENPELAKYCKDNNFIWTPADINYDTRGWDIHPHRLYRRVEGIFPKLCKTFLLERDKVKYELGQYVYNSPLWVQKNLYQLGLKTLANSGYGAFGFKSFRFFQYDIGDTITTVCRYIMKKSIVFASTRGYNADWGDTDSSYLTTEGETITINEMDYEFYKYYDTLVEPYNTICEIEHTNPKVKVELKEVNKTLEALSEKADEDGDGATMSEIQELEEHKKDLLLKLKENKNHFIVFEWEKTFESAIVVKKKRYYFKQIMDDGKIKYGTQGGAYLKTDTMPIAADLQKQLCKDILDDNYDSDKWFNIIKDLKVKVDKFELEESHIVMTKGVNAKVEDYGKPTIDGKTGKPKVKKDGNIQYAPVPCHIKVAKEMLAAGKEIAVGDKIDYVIVGHGPLEGISVDDFRKNPRYDEIYYWTRIESPLLEILRVVDKENVYDKFYELWSFAWSKPTKAQLKKDPEAQPKLNEKKRDKLKAEINVIDDSDDE